MKPLLMNRYKMRLQSVVTKQNATFPFLEAGIIMKSFLTRTVLPFHRKLPLNLMDRNRTSVI